MEMVPEYTLLYSYRQWYCSLPITFTLYSCYGKREIGWCSVSAKVSLFSHYTHLGTADSNSMDSSDTFVCNLEVLQPVPLDLKHNICGANYSDHNWVYVTFISSLTNVLTDKRNGWLISLFCADQKYKVQVTGIQKKIYNSEEC